MKLQIDRLARHAPPLWMSLLAAGIVAALLLGGFVVVLQDHLRRGAEMRRAFVQPVPQVAAAGESATPLR